MSWRRRTSELKTQTAFTPTKRRKPTKLWARQASMRSQRGRSSKSQVCRAASRPSSSVCLPLKAQTTSNAKRSCFNAVSFHANDFHLAFFSSALKRKTRGDDNFSRRCPLKSLLRSAREPFVFGCGHKNSLNFLQPSLSWPPFFNARQKVSRGVQVIYRYNLFACSH